MILKLVQYLGSLYLKHKGKEMFKKYILRIIAQKLMEWVLEYEALAKQTEQDWDDKGIAFLKSKIEPYV